MTKAASEEKAVATKKPGEVVSRGEEFEHWLDRFMDEAKKKAVAVKID